MIVKCANCGYENTGDTRCCAKCGAELGTRFVSSVDTVKCHSCGCINQGNVNKCVYCGAELPTRRISFGPGFTGSYRPSQSNGTSSASVSTQKGRDKKEGGINVPLLVGEVLFFFLLAFGITVFARSRTTSETITISFDGGGADEGSMDPLSCNPNESFTLPTCAYTRNGYTFDCWTDSAGTEYEEGDQLSPDHDMVFTAQWKQKKQVTLVFDGGGASGTGNQSITCSKNSTVTLPDCQFVYANHEFECWADDKGATYPAGYRFKVRRTTTLYAQWADITPAVISPYETGPDDFVLRDSNVRNYSRDEIDILDDYGLYIARNEILARHGRGFRDAEARAYFFSKNWYTYTIDWRTWNNNYGPLGENQNSPLNNYERANINLIFSIEENRGSVYAG